MVGCKIIVVVGGERDGLVESSGDGGSRSFSLGYGRRRGDTVRVWVAERDYLAWPAGVKSVAGLDYVDSG